MTEIDRGHRSAKYGHLGVHYLCTGPDPRGPRPGPRLKAVIYDQGWNIVRRLEQVTGKCTDEGHVSFFGGPADRPAQFELPIVDISPDGVQTILVTDFQPNSPRWLLEAAFNTWALAYGARK